ncbi:MAG: hypothetical protein RLZZ561_1707 [Pseudomonadota bacterium]|jgi:hypothetical protein
MIAHKFRPVVWVVGCAFAATALYTVSLGVASERTRMEELDQQIAMTQRDIRQLQTEMGTRASLRQLERWNVEALALSAPKAGQFRATEAALKTIDGGALPADGFTPPPVMVAAATRPAATGAAAPVEQKIAMASPAAAPVPAKASKAVSNKPQATDSKGKSDKAAPAKAQRFAMLDRALVDKRTFNEILVRAESESRTGAGKGKTAP